MFSQISIRTKITSVVALLLVALAGMGLLAIRNMQAINANTVEIANNWLPSIRTLGELRYGVTTYRNIVHQHMLAETLPEKLALEKTLAEVVEGNNKTRQTYEPMISSPEERALYNEWNKAWDEYKSGAAEVLALSRKAIGQTSQEAEALNTGTLNKISSEADAILKRDIDLNNAGAAAETKSSADTYGSALIVMAIVFGVAVTFGVGVGIYLVRDVSRGIASIVQPMQALGSGDLTAQVPHQGEKTEIGAMADTLQVLPTRPLHWTPKPRSSAAAGLTTSPASLRR